MACRHTNTRTFGIKKSVEGRHFCLEYYARMDTAHKCTDNTLNRTKRSQYQWHKFIRKKYGCILKYQLHNTMYQVVFTHAERMISGCCFLDSSSLGSCCCCCCLFQAVSLRSIYHGIRYLCNGICF